MALRNETPPPPGNLEVEPPPASDRPTTAQLKADIDSGRTGDKVSHYDPGLSQLGTDDEAAGNPPSAARIATARETEAQPARVRAGADPHGHRPWLIPAFAGFVAAVIAVVGTSLWLAG